MNCKQAADLLGVAPRTVEYWINRYLDDDLLGLATSDRSGRSPRLSSKQIDEINKALREEPKAVGPVGGMWDQKMLSSYINKPMILILVSGNLSAYSDSLGFASGNQDRKLQRLILSFRKSLKKTKD